MMKLHSPQLVSLSEASLLHALMSETRRPNLMVVCRRVTVEAAVRHVVSYCEPPYQMVPLPGKMELTDATRGTVLLADVAMMSLGQQMRLYDRLSAGHDLPQIVSISSVPLRPLVEDGRFLEGLMYRLNVISLEATPVDMLPQNVTPIRPGVRYEALAS
jgi:transcriptional regulator of aromatic amino acid metabolism